MIRGRRSTPPGQHRPVLLDEVLAILDPQPGQTIVDATVGWAGHAVEILRRLLPEGRLLGVDLDSENLPRARERLETVGGSFTLHHANFAGLAALLGEQGTGPVDGVLADLGMSSMQVDDPERGFSYARPGPLDMRMDRSRGRTAAQLLAELPQGELARVLRGLGDEPEAERIAAARYLLEASCRVAVLVHPWIPFSQQKPMASVRPLSSGHSLVRPNLG